MKKLKPVPKNKKKSLGKLPPKVRNKMGFMKKWWKSKIVNKLWNKVIDKIFGKRCKCINRKRETKTIFECIDCGKVLSNG